MYATSSGLRTGSKGQRRLLEPLKLDGREHFYIVREAVATTVAFVISIPGR